MAAVLIRWAASLATVTLCGIVPTHFCVRPSSIHRLHTRITVIAACPVRAKNSQYDKLGSEDQSFCPVKTQ